MFQTKCLTEEINLSIHLKKAVKISLQIMNCRNKSTETRFLEINQMFGNK